jgi:hypothetical protein
MANNQSTPGYPGFSSLYDYYSAYFQGLGTLAETYNKTWNTAITGPDYTFGAWVKDFGKIWSLNYDLFTKLARVPLPPSGDRDGPVWVPIVSDKASDSPASAWVNLRTTVEPQRVPVSTNLELLGAGGPGGGSILGTAVLVELNSQRDAVKVTIPIDRTAPPTVGTYVGFVRVSGPAGEPLAIIFFSYGT